MCLKPVNVKFLSIIPFLIFLQVFSYAQEKVYKIKAGQEIGDVIPFSEVYKYPTFQFASVLFLNGGEGNALLNYNFLNGEMEFIDQNGDTLSLADERTIKYILIDKDTFYFDNGYINVISSYDTKKLAKKQLITLVDKKNLGAFDFPVSAGTENYTIYQNVKLKVKADVTMKLESFYFIGERQKFYPVTKKNILKLYKKNEDLVSKYLIEQPVSFSNEKDLIRLFDFLKKIDR